MSQGRVFDADVVVVGAGPAGASTALHLVREEGIAARRIMMLDRARFPREKPCAGAISDLGVRALAAIGVKPSVPSIDMRGLRVVLQGEVGETHAPMGILVRRIEFDASLVAEARRDGVVVRDGEALMDVERIDGGFRLTTSRNEITTRLVAACDGSGSTTRKLLCLREVARKGQLYVLETPCGEGDGAASRGLVDFDLTVTDDGIQGYYWDFPTVIDRQLRMSRGIYHANLAPGSRVKASLARALCRRGIAIDSVRLKPFSTRPFVPGAPTWVEGVVLVGEAAGIDRTTGEGIAQSILMGGIAARHLARALRTGGTSFEPYAFDVTRSTLGRHLLQSAWLAQHVYAPRGAAARRLLARSTFARAAAVRWYRGERLSLWVQARLAGGLVGRLFQGAAQSLPLSGGSSGSPLGSSGRKDGVLESMSRGKPPTWRESGGIDSGLESGGGGSVEKV